MTSKPSRILRIGVDVGGTNTDAVVLELTPGAPKSVLASAKSPTTAEVTLGIQTAIKTVLDQVGDVPPIQALSIGTTHFVNALISRDTSRLDKVAVIRLCGPFSRGTPPFSGFPYELRDVLEGPHFFVEGGLQIDGSEISKVKAEEIEHICVKLKDTGIRAVAIVSVFAPIDYKFKQEEQVEAIIHKLLPNIRTVCSKDVANISLLERENATILNASLLAFAEITVDNIRTAAKALSLTCPVFITSNDGTLLSCEQAARLPIRTFSSGPTNSMRGAAFLASLFAGETPKETALVVDIGGTSTDVGVLLPTGFPRQAASHHELCGVRLNFSMPHVTSIALGGGSLIRRDEQTQRYTVGPDSVGYRLTKEALVFGGSTLTATDITVASGRVTNVGNAATVADINPLTIEGVQNQMKTMLELVLDLMKTSDQDIPAYIVGGGAILAPNSLKGVSQLIQLPYFDCANAIGAACAEVSGVVDSVEDISKNTMAIVQKEVEARAIARAIASGAHPDKVKIIESEAIPTAYVTGSCRFYVKAAGEWSGVPVERSTDPDVSVEETLTKGVLVTPTSAHPSTTSRVDPIWNAAEISTYRPQVVGGGWFLSAIDLEWISVGCYILGCGGGGDTHHIFLWLREIVRAGGSIRVIDISSLQPDDLIGWGGYLGSPEVASERLGDDACVEATQELMKYMGTGRLQALAPVEVGGGNGMTPMIVGASTYLDLPIVDGDYMGRAYPTAWQVTPNIYDLSGHAEKMLPACVSSGDGSILFLAKAKSDRTVDSAFRAACLDMGTLVGAAFRPLPAEFCAKAMIKNTTSLSWRLGRAVALANKQQNVANVGRILVDALGGPDSGRVLFSGKITEVSRRLYKGHTMGEVVIAALAEGDDLEADPQAQRFHGIMKIPFKNENLFAEHILGGNIEIVATVPDLICVLDAQSGAAIGTPQYKYGLRVLVLGVTASPQWTESERGLEMGDLRAFGFDDIPYKPLGKYTKPVSVIEEYGI